LSASLRNGALSTRSTPTGQLKGMSVPYMIWPTPCIPQWLNQAGVNTDFVLLETVGIRGNSHMMMLEKNSDDVIKFIVSWIQKNTTT